MDPHVDAALARARALLAKDLRCAPDALGV